MNVAKTDFQNSMANFYADAYGLLKTAGSDNHIAGKGNQYAGIECEEPITSVSDFIEKARAGRLSLFRRERKDSESPLCDVAVEFRFEPRSL